MNISAIKSTYIKRPGIKTNGFITEGWDSIINHINHICTSKKTLIIDCYTGIHYEDIKNRFSKLGGNTLFIDSLSLFKPESEVKEMTERFMTDDFLFGRLTNLSMSDYFDPQKVKDAQNKIQDNNGLTIIFGYGASLVASGDITVYADMPRWEIQLRMRKSEVTGLGIDNRNEPISYQHKRGLFNDWKVCDKHKRSIYPVVDFWLDTTSKTPRMIDKTTFFDGMEKAATSPFRVMPLFDPAPWGGQWMKEVCDLDRSRENFGWCFDCVPEENSLILEVNNIEFEMPAVNLVYTKTTKLLGEPVESRFGCDFPIRFDFLDTVKGGNLSLQVHPTTQYVYDNFGIHYTQDESYYLVDAEDDAFVYLGLKNGINKDEMIDDLRKAEKGEIVFDADKYANKIPAKKHDHFLIPGGTLHCSGKNAVVLEISSTPNIFTFKLWDWQRLGLDGKPRPINVERGKDVLQWNRNTDYTYEHLVNKFEIISEGDGWIEEKTGLHKNEFIETRRHTFSKAVRHTTNDSVNVINLIDGEEIVVESLNGEFDPFIVHYAETFIIPACIEEYIIRPHGLSEGKECKTIKAFVRT